jgi:hypothetical protein
MLERFTHYPTGTLPWHMRYLAFSGPLPQITDLVTNVVGFSMRYREPFGINCLWSSTAAEPAIVTFSREAGGALRKRHSAAP